MLKAYKTLQLGDNAELAGAEKLDDVADLGAVGHLLLYLKDGVEKRRLAVEDEAVGVGDVLLHFFVSAVEVEHRGVDAAILHLLRTDDARRHVLREGGTCLNHGCTAHACLRVLDD